MITEQFRSKLITRLLEQGATPLDAQRLSADVKYVEIGGVTCVEHRGGVYTEAQVSDVAAILGYGTTSAEDAARASAVADGKAMAAAQKQRNAVGQAFE